MRANTGYENPSTFPTSQASQMSCESYETLQKTYDLTAPAFRHFAPQARVVGGQL